MEGKEKEGLRKFEEERSSRRDFIRGAFTATAGGLIALSEIAAPKLNVVIAQVPLLITVREGAEG